MARLITSGFETNRVGTVNTELDGLSAGGTALSIVTTSPHGGTYAARCASGAGNATAFAQFPFTVVGSTSYYLRCYCRFSSLPLSGNIILLSIGSPGTNGASIRVNSAGDLLLWDDKTNAQIGSSLITAIASSNGTVWYRLELTVTLNATPTVTSVTGLIDGSQIATGSISPTGAMTGLISAGWITAPGATRTVDLDDIAFNDSSGGSQNTYPGAGSIVLLVPTADSAIGTGWTLGTGTAPGGNGFAAVDNKPPTAVADLTAGSDPKQIRNAGSNANSNADFTMQTYTANGIPAGAVISLIDPVICTGAPSATSPKVGQVGVVSNPAITAINLTGGSGSFYNNVAVAGAYPTGWKWSHGTITYTPSVTLGTAPVMRVTQVTSSTRISMVCFIGMYVEYFVQMAKSGYGKENG